MAGNALAGRPTVDSANAVIGQSNASGRGANNQVSPASGAWLYANDGQFTALADPWDGGVDTYTALDDGVSAAGSYIPRMAVNYANAGKTSLWVPANKSETTVLGWQRNLATPSLYGAMKARIDAAGGVDKIIIHLGESDAMNGTTQSVFVSRMNQLVVDLIADFGCDVYLQKIHSFSGYAAGCATIRAAIEEVWTGASGVKPGADLDGITASVHFSSDLELTTVADRTYAAIEQVNANATGATLTGAAEIISGAATGDSNATAPGTTVTGTGVVIGGAATGGSGTGGTFTFDACENNTHSGALSGVAVNWTWLGGTVGAITSITNGSGTMTTGGMTISGLPTGTGCGILRSSDGTVVAYQEGTVS